MWLQHKQLKMSYKEAEPHAFGEGEKRTAGSFGSIYSVIESTKKHYLVQDFQEFNILKQKGI